MTIKMIGFFLLLCLCLAFFLNWNKSSNPVCQYLTNVEIQCEGQEQKNNIKQALRDMLRLSIQQLKKKRYKDYKGKARQWDLKTLIYRHFVPDNQQKRLGQQFYKNIKSPCAQKMIKTLLKKLN